MEERLDWRFLDLRSPENRLIFRSQTTLERAMRELWSREGFIEIHSPKLKPTPNQSGSELSTVAYFDRQAHLAQSPQFYKQMAMAAGFERVFEFGPVFRATRCRPHGTTRSSPALTWRCRGSTHTRT
ncbi:MAG TPA: amino acid--tRNA ligase-related protein [Acidimicrobiales bacterium]|nr:amino acid--tRNA ligase-related protein [Acidimicrobiales bacterium]